MGWEYLARPRGQSQVGGSKHVLPWVKDGRRACQAQSRTSRLVQLEVGILSSRCQGCSVSKQDFLTGCCASMRSLCWVRVVPQPLFSRVFFSPDHVDAKTSGAGEA